MLNTVTTVVVALLGVHIIAKYGFFGLPCRKRREALDNSYGDKPSATTLSDVIVLGSRSSCPACCCGAGSYAIQASPWRPWPQMSALAVLVVWSRVLILTG